jgi:hypothetical protein
METEILVFFPGNTGKITVLAQSKTRKIHWHHKILLPFFNSVDDQGAVDGNYSLRYNRGNPGKPLMK